MKFVFTVLSLSQLLTAHYVTDFAGNLVGEVSSPSSKINLGQAQIEKHNEVKNLGYFGHGFVKSPYYIPTFSQDYGLYHGFPLAYNPVMVTGFRPHKYPLTYFPTYGTYKKVLNIPAAGRVASPATKITVGSLNNSNQAGISKE